MRSCPFCNGNDIKLSIKSVGGNRIRTNFHVTLYCNDCKCSSPRLLYSTCNSCLSNEEKLIVSQKVEEMWNTRRGV